MPKGEENGGIGGLDDGGESPPIGEASAPASAAIEDFGAGTCEERIANAAAIVQALRAESAQAQSRAAQLASQLEESQREAAQAREALTIAERSRNSRRTGAAMSPATTNTCDALLLAAEQAARTGDRAALLRYLRTRRER